MAFRTFVDSAGQEWQVYDVVPPADERRHYDRRGEESPDGNSERRISEDRRLTVGRVSQLVTTASDGWLCFDSGEDRRRLMPIPADWTRISDEELERLRDSARQVKLTPGSSQSIPRGTPVLD